MYEIFQERKNGQGSSAFIYMGRVHHCHIHGTEILETQTAYFLINK